MFSYSGPVQPFAISPASDAAELQFVRANVHPLLQAVGKIQVDSLSWTSDGDYAAVLVKAAQEWVIFLNVSAGQVLTQTLIVNNNGRPQNISHVSRFVCRG